MVGGEGGGPEAGAVTARPVGCSAWLGVAGIGVKVSVIRGEVRAELVQMRLRIERLNTGTQMCNAKQKRRN